MRRGYWMGAVVGALCLAGLARSQGPREDRLIVVQEEGKPAQKCRILKCWRERDGSTACQAQSLATGEIMTIIDPASMVPGPLGRPETARGPRIFPWGRNSAPPRGAPTPPPDAVVVAQPVPAPAPPERPALLTRMFASSAPNAPVAPKALAVQASEPKLVDARVPSVSAPEPPLADAQVPAISAPVAQAVPAPKAERGGLFSSWRERPSGAVRLPRAQPTSDDPLKRPDDYARLTAEKGGNDVPSGSPFPGSPATGPTATPNGPLAKAPAERPSWRERLGLGASKPAEKTEKAPSSTATERMWTPTGRMIEVPVETRNAFTETKEQPKDAAPGAGAPPAWSGPRYAGGAYPSGPYPAVAPPPALPPYPSGPPYTTPIQTANGQMYVPTRVLLDGGTPGGLANAFTATSSTRPIPPDFGPLPTVANAFNDPAAALSQAPPMPAAPTMPANLPASLPERSHLPVAHLELVSLVGHASVVLRDSLYPSEREMAAAYMGKCDWHKEPAIVEALLRSAKSDPAPAVRAACVEALGRLKANTVPVVTAVQRLKNDTDPRVRQATEEALAVLLAP